MCMYALSIQAASQAKQCWFADDVRGCGSLQNIMVWWEKLTMARPDFGCYPNAGKYWLAMKPDKETTTRSIGQYSLAVPRSVAI